GCSQRRSRRRPGATTTRLSASAPRRAHPGDHEQVGCLSVPPSRGERVWAAGSPRHLANTGCRPLDILGLYELADMNPRRAAHLAMLRTMQESVAGHRVIAWNCANGVPRWIRSGRYDVVMLDALLMAARARVDFAERRPMFDWVAQTDAVRIAMPQDE